MGPTSRMWMEIGRESERSEVMRAGIGAGVAAEREDLRDDGREVKESLVQCGSMWVWRVRNVSRPEIGAEVMVVATVVVRKRMKREIAAEVISEAVTDRSTRESELRN